MNQATTVPAGQLLTAGNHALMLVDHQSQMAFATRSIDVVALRNHSALIAKSAVGFGVPTIVTTVAEKSFSGPLFPEIGALFAAGSVIDRTTMNPWEDPTVVKEINRIGRRRVAVAGLWTSVCIAGPVLTGLEQGFEIHVITDACGDVTDEAHERAVQRMVQAGARPMTSLQYLLELQRDWGRGETYDLTTGIANVHGGGYGLGIQYAGAMFGGREGGH